MATGQGSTTVQVHRAGCQPPSTRHSKPKTSILGCQQQPSTPTSYSLTFGAAGGLHLAEVQLCRGREHHCGLRPVPGLECPNEQPRAPHGVEVSLPGFEPVGCKERSRWCRRRPLPEGDPHGLPAEDELARHGSWKPENCVVCVFHTAARGRLLLFSRMLSST